MTRPTPLTLALALGLAFLATPALAANAEPQAAGAPAPAATAPRKIEGVVVQGKRRPRLTRCDDRDAACIAAVITELKTRYPEQLKVWCFRQKMDEMRGHMNAATLADPSDPAQGGAGYEVTKTPTIRMVCATAEK